MPRITQAPRGPWPGFPFTPSDNFPKPKTWDRSVYTESNVDLEMPHEEMGTILDPDRSMETVPHFDRLMGPTAASRFQYRKLQENDEIRLLILHPGEDSDPLDFDLRHTRIMSDKEEKYKAMSYAWGTVMVDIAHRDGGVLGLPENLYRGLLRLRPSPTCNTSLVLWADSICINQNDTEERRHQVRLMRKIYQQSAQVIVWLGEEHWRLAERVFGLSRRVFEKQVNEIPNPEYHYWSHVLYMFNKEWFCRLWCLQEIVLAGSAEVHWGPFVAPWEHLGFTASWICNAGYEVIHSWLRNARRYERYEEKSDYSFGVHRASLMYSLYLAYKSPDPQPLSFSLLLDMTRQFETGDPRDKIFALIGIPTNDADPDAGNYVVDPDYTKQSAQVYKYLAQLLIEQSGNLRLLSAVQHRSLDKSYILCHEGLAELPTWVPNWTISECRTLVPSSPSESQPSRSASLNLRPPETRITIQSDWTLMTTGLVLDEVDEVESLMSRGTSKLLLHVLSRAYSTVVKRLGSDATYRSLGVAFVWTITGGMDWRGNPLSIQDPQHRRTHIGDYRAFQSHLLSQTGSLKYMRSDAHAFPEDFDLEKTLPDIDEEIDIDEGEMPDFRRFLEAVWHATSNRKFFVTKKGYMGLCPMVAKPGHRVAILHGADLPMILESVQDNAEEGSEEGMFKVVGESYVHSIMDGEISGDGASEIRTIKLV